jgi:glycosyltransferase involved in cell wall biosynthesis
MLITQDEEALMERALRSCAAFADEYVVVDSGSRDGTVERARRLGCSVYHNPWPGYAKQRNFGIARARHEWVFLIDTDEVVGEKLARSILAWKTDRSAREDAYVVMRRRNFFDRWLNLHPQVRLFRRELRYRDMLVHEKFAVDDRRAHRLAGTLWHHTFRTLEDEVRRENLYSSLAAEEASRTREFSLARLLFRPPARFVRNYLARGLFRKGLAGFAQSVLWAQYEFLAELKLYELNWRARTERMESEPDRVERATSSVRADAAEDASSGMVGVDRASRSSNSITSTTVQHEGSPCARSPLPDGWRGEGARRAPHDVSRSANLHGPDTEGPSLAGAT